MINQEREIQEGNEQKPFMTPKEFELLLKHTEVVIDPQTGILGNLTRLADSPIEEGGIPVKRYRISLDQDMTREHAERMIVRYLSIVRRDLVRPEDENLIEIDEKMNEFERGVSDFYKEHAELVRQVPIKIFEASKSPTTG